MMRMRQLSFGDFSKTPFRRKTKALAETFEAGLRKQLEVEAEKISRRCR
jgi:hypothetical protein